MTEFPSIRVVMALEAESAGVFEAAGIAVLYCGVGKVNAAIALTRELARYRHNGAPLPLVANFGSAGSREYTPGTLIACHQFIQRDMDVVGLGYPLGVTPFEETPACLSFPQLLVQLPTASCGSGDSFATAATLIPCGVIDMEAYALAKVCWLEKTGFVCAKYVTDGANPEAAERWQQSVHAAAEEFLDLYQGLCRLDRGAALV